MFKFIKRFFEYKPWKETFKHLLNNRLEVVDKQIIEMQEELEKLYWQRDRLQDKFLKFLA